MSVVLLDDAGDAVEVGGDKPERERRDRRGDIARGHGEDRSRLVAGIAATSNTARRRARDADAATTRVEGVLAVRFREIDGARRSCWSVPQPR